MTGTHCKMPFGLPVVGGVRPRDRRPYITALQQAQAGHGAASFERFLYELTGRKFGGVLERFAGGADRPERTDAAATAQIGWRGGTPVSL
jgi:hypothetical protein